VHDSELSTAIVEAIGHTAVPIEWGDMTLVQGVNDIMARFRTLHPGLTVDALREIGRCVGWNWR
jgi:hypothetical protein